MRISSLAACLLATFPFLIVDAHASSIAPTIQTTTGTLQGSSNGIERYLGIPYAAPPVGPLRWKPPQPAAAWTGVRPATHFASHCMQTQSVFGRPGSEDCLYLNVYTPAHTGAARPVMVWIHGGAFIYGESEDYDGTALAKAGNVVVVTVNYRLGAFGFLANSGLAAEPGNVVGNYGLLDQQAALRWVKANIGAFGGDPSRVTIFGESAGGSSVSMQLASPGGAGLFQRAIIESGFYDPTPNAAPEALATGASFATALGCASQDPACLRAIPASAVQQASIVPFNEAGPDALFGAAFFGPVRGTTTLPLAPISAFAAGSFNHVPVLNGTNHDELGGLLVAGLDPSPDPLALKPYADEGAIDVNTASAIYAALLGNNVSLSLQLATYLPAGQVPIQLVSRLGSDALFSCTARLADLGLSKYVPTYAYEFNVGDSKTLLVPPSGGFPTYGATHTNEIGYLFPSFASQFPSLGVESFTAPQATLSATMIAAWTNFARNGNPNGGAVPAWSPYTAAADRFESLAAPTPSPESGFALDHNCAVYDPLLAAGIGFPLSALGDL